MEDLWAAVLERYGGVAEFASNQQNRVVGGFENVIDEMEAFRSLGFYQGFDPEETMKRLAARNLEYANSE
ncbi:Hypothetical protein NTJ_02696 [Nesidiocoris tenuis]|uniref:Uncharacterized protein n=1 Tax=Nesidiocoris tenuis TaxID=355587 RepID=A0ABN7AC79_9HEMI|nr:Hypothetical protein NTJ_02696 [Nesidiocoris tenuis]